jgi:hypothetical protein
MGSPLQDLLPGLRRLFQRLRVWQAADRLRQLQQSSDFGALPGHSGYDFIQVSPALERLQLLLQEFIDVIHK